MGKIKGIFSVPQDIRDQFWNQLLARNWKMMFVISIFAAAAQLVNVCHVLILSSRKLETLNNRIYFTFYCVFLLLNLLFLAAESVGKKKMSRRAAIILQGTYGIIWIVWNGLLNYYDILASDWENNNTSVIVTCLLGASIIVQTVPLYAVCTYGLSALLFSLAAYPALQTGGVINVMIAGVMAVIVSWAKYQYSLKDLRKQHTIQKMNEKLGAKHEQLNLSLQKFQFVVEEMDNILLEWDMEHGTITFSGNWKDKMGCDKVITDVEKWFKNSACMDRKQKRELLRGIQSAVKAREIYETEIRIFTQDRDPEWYLLRFLFQFQKDGKVKSGIGFLTNIQRQKSEMAQLRSAMNRDYLTGAFSRKAIQDYAQAQMEHARKDNSVAMIIIDLDDFKQINDHYGHPFGDQVLKKTAEALADFFHGNGEVGRIGGDEFMAVMSPISGSDMLEEKIRQLQRESVTVCGEKGEVRVHFSLGGALAQRGESYHSLYQRADTALYQAKDRKKESCEAKSSRR